MNSDALSANLGALRNSMTTLLVTHYFVTEEMKAELGHSNLTGTVPIIYLPGVSRMTLRATEDCPHELKPLAELPCPRCGGSLAAARFYGPCSSCQEELRRMKPPGRRRRKKAT